MLDSQEPTNGSSWWRPGLIMLTELSAWTVAPVLFGFLIGRVLDQKFETEPIIMVSLSAVAFIFAIVKIYRIAQDAMDDVSRTPETEELQNHGDDTDQSQSEPTRGPLYHA